MKYELYLYDIWGNDIDGYTVNDVIPTGKLIFKNISKEHLCKILKLNDPYQIEINAENEGVIFVDYKGEPYCELREVQNND